MSGLMRRTVIILTFLTAVSLAVFGCIGGGRTPDGQRIISSAPPVQEGSPTAPASGATATRTLGPTGGEIPLGNFTITFPAGSFTDSTTVTVTSLGAGPVLETQGDPVGSIINVEMRSAAKLSSRVRPRSQAAAVPIITFTVEGDGQYLIVRRGNLSIAGESFLLTEYPAFTTSTAGEDSSVRVSTVDNFFHFGSSVTFALLSLDSLLAAVPPADLVPFDAATRTEIVEQPLGNKVPIVLVHGYDSREHHTEGSEQSPWNSLYKQLVWETFYSRIAVTGLEKLADNVQIYEFIYPTWKSVEENGQALAQEILASSELKDSERIMVVAHSMGGLVARRALEYGVQDNIKKIVTLGTPHHGSILASFKYLLDQVYVSLSSNQALARDLLKYYAEHLNPLNTTGFSDLCWDNYDNTISANLQAAGLRVNSSLASFNQSSVNDGLLVSQAGTYRTGSSGYSLGYSLMKDFYPLWNGKSYESDGTVPLFSAHFHQHQVETASFSDHNHADLYEDELVQQAVLEIVNQYAETSKDNLLPAAPAVIFSRAPEATSFTLSWSAVSGATSYNVYMDDEFFNSVSVPLTSATLTRLLPQETYSVSVSAVNAAGEGPCSDVIEVTTLSGDSITGGLWSGTFSGDATGKVTFKVAITKHKVTGTFNGTFIREIDGTEYEGTFAGTLVDGTISDDYQLQANMTGTIYFLSPVFFTDVFFEDESILAGQFDFTFERYDGSWVVKSNMDTFRGTWTATAAE